jgi:hypothetical protein
MNITDNPLTRTEDTVFRPLQKLTELSKKHVAISLIIIIFVALCFKIFFFTGWGLGDDPAYMHRSAYFTVVPDGSREMRTSVELPTAILFRLFGINNVTYSLVPLMISLLVIAGTFLLLRETTGHVSALIAALLLSFSTFDLVFSTTMTIDFYVAAGSLFSLLFFIKGIKSDRFQTSIAWFVGSTGCFLFLYYVKIPSVMFIAVIAVVGLLFYRERFKRLLVYAGMFTALIAVILTVERFTFGSWFGHLKVNTHEHVPQGLGLLLDYVRWMFKLYDGQYRLFGYLFFLAVPALVWAIFPGFRKNGIALVWFIVYFLLLNFLPYRLFPYSPIPRFFRYTYMLVPPAIMLIAGAIYGMKRFPLGRTLALLLLISFVVTSLIHARIQHRDYTDSMLDLKAAVSWFDDVDDTEPIYCDNFFYDYFTFHNNMQTERRIQYWMDGVPVWKMPHVTRVDRFKDVSHGYLVTGGARYWHMPSSSYLNLYNRTLPPEWKLMTTIDLSPRLMTHKAEPLKIYHKSRYIPDYSTIPIFLQDQGITPVPKKDVRGQFLVDRYHGWVGKEFEQMVKDQNGSILYSASELTPSVLNGVSTVVLGYHPGMKGYSEDEYRYLFDFFNQGGRIIIMAISWTYDERFGREFPYNPVSEYFGVRYTTLLSWDDTVTVNRDTVITSGTKDVGLDNMIHTCLDTFGDGVTPLLRDKAGRVLGAASVKGDARAIVLGHCNFGYDGQVTGSDTREFLVNSISWLMSDR